MPYSPLPGFPSHLHAAAGRIRLACFDVDGTLTDGRLCLMVMLFDRELAEYDRLKLLRLCLVHDLGEAISGDVPATCQSPDDGRAARERADLETLCAPLPDDLRREILSLWDDYSGGTTPEARMVKGFDKLETMLQHLIGRNAADFDYAFNLTYGTQHTVRHPLLFQIRELVDAATRERIAACGTPK